MRGRTRGAAVLLAVMGWLTASVALGGAKVALIIGNGAYQHARVLRNPVQDAKSIAEALRGLGYTVQLLTDATKPQIEAALVNFGNSVRGADQAVIFFSGHGIEVRGANFLLPVEVRMQAETTVSAEAVSLSEIMDVASSARQLGLVVLDACRDDPLADSMARADGTKGADRGLAGVEPSGSNLLVAYATKHGRTAADGKGEHSPYTLALLEALQVPGLEVRQLFGRVRNRVLAETGKLQEPFTYGTLGEEALYLHPAPASAGSARPASSTVVDPRAEELAVWQAAQAADTPAAYQEYLSQYPSGKYSNLARILLTSRSAQGGAPSTSSQHASSPVRADSSSQHSTSQGDRDCADCPQMVRIPAGSFVMGSPTSEPGRNSDEAQHTVHVPAFSLAKYDVTFDDWDACVAAGGCKTRPSDAGWGRGARPVINVSWQDAQQYADWMSRKTSMHYRLPSESEWEYAARAGTTSTYYWGNDLGKGHANCLSCGGPLDKHKTLPVGSFAANPWGLFDMAGNVEQFTQDCYAPSYEGAPVDGKARVVSNCYSHVARGGSWNGDPRELRVAFRLRNDLALDIVGFRLARTE